MILCLGPLIQYTAIFKKKFKIPVPKANNNCVNNKCSFIRHLKWTRMSDGISIKTTNYINYKLFFIKVDALEL